jgi:hypothetical protein
MGLSHFPKGVSSFGIPVIGSGIPPTTGSYFFVHSGTGNAGNVGKDPSSPLAKIDQAINKCTANKGDVIVCMPGHAETVAAAGSIDADIAGITIVGLGNGTNRPKISFTLATSDIDIDAANITIDNFYLDMCDTITSVAQAFDVNAANFTLRNCEVLMSVGSVIALSVVVTDANAHNMTLDNVRILSPVAGAEEGIKIVGAHNGLVIRDCVVNGDFSVAPIHNPTGNVATNILISDCFLKNDQAGDFALELVSACTGALVRNYYHTNALATAVDPGSCFSYECYTCHAVDKNGLLTPGVDS